MHFGQTSDLVLFNSIPLVYFVKYFCQENDMLLFRDFSEQLVIVAFSDDLLYRKKNSKNRFRSSVLDIFCFFATIGKT
jgi:hypothetical protein